MVGTDFPYRDWYPEGKTVIQIDARPEHIGRRDARRRSAWSGTPRRRCARCSTAVTPKRIDSAPRQEPRQLYDDVARAPGARSPIPTTTRRLVGRVREKFDNTDERIRPEALAQRDRPARRTRRRVHDRHRHVDGVAVALRHDDATGAALLGSFNLGSMANAMPQALGAQALDRTRQVIAFCGDGGLSMLLGDLITAVSLRPAGEADRVRQRPAGHGQARAGAGRPARVRHRAAQPRLRRRRPRDRAARRARRGPRRPRRRRARRARASRPGAARRRSPTRRRSRSPAR